MELTPNEVELRELITQAQAGDEVAMLTLLERFKPLRFALGRHWGRRIPNHSQGVEWDDLVQEIDLHFVTAVKRYDPQKDPHPIRYLANATRTKTLDFYRQRMYKFTKKGRDPRPTTLSFERFRNWAVVAEAPTTVEEHDIESLIEVLTPIQRIVIRLKMEGWTDVEIGKKIGRARSSVTEVKKRALAQLRPDILGVNIQLML